MIKKIVLLASTVLFSLAAQAQQFPENVIIQDIAIAKQGKEVPLERLAPGELITVEFSRMPIYIYKRTPADILTLKTSQRDSLADPDSENFRASC